MVNRNKVAVITGASHGIGFAIASELASRGYSLGLIARSRTDIEDASQRILTQYPEVRIINDAFDVIDGASADEFIRKVHSGFGNVSVLVNNAGYYRQGTSSLPVEEQQLLLDVNYLAAVRFVQAVLPIMKKNKRGHIFNIASLCGVEAFSDVGGYAASKFALVGYSSALAQELAPLGIKVTALCPSWVNTRNSKDAPMEPDNMIQPDDMALTIRYLLDLGPTVSIREIVIRC
jgi:short-subunit dehydrogenase